ncbi:ATP-binding protein [Thalassospiraceae bacterium LMO-JJ14]|nr:ATP-binding protein [Thalassospiraceae bacterium LMO-JJ14]
MVNRINEKPTPDMSAPENDTLSEMLEGSPIGAAILDLHSGKRKFVNSALVRMFGAASHADMLSRDIDETWADPDELHRAFGIFQRNTLVNFEAERRRFDGSNWWVLMNTQPVTFQGAKAGIVWHVDITDRKKAEDQLVAARIESEKANHAKSEFLAHVSHELRTPLNSILGFSEILLSPPTPVMTAQKQTEYARSIHDSGQHLLGIINNILDISKIEAGEFKLHETSFELGDALADACHLLHGIAAKNDIRMRYEPAPAPPKIHADERIIKQIAMNLLSNAIKFNVSGGSVVMTSETAADGAISISVRDTGIGISGADIPKILEPFGQVRDSAHRSHQGTGLGLSLSKYLAELHGGTLTIASEPGKGTEVRISLPPERMISK